MTRKKVKKVVRKVKKMKILPFKMSALIKIALADIRKAEALKDQYIIDMSTWYQKESAVCTLPRTGQVIKKHDVCIMCAAGSVMQFSLGAANRIPEHHANGIDLEPADFTGNQIQLNAINSLRTGDIGNAASVLFDGVKWGKVCNKLYHNGLEDGVDIPDYETEDPEPFHKALTKLQHQLAKIGL